MCRAVWVLIVGASTDACSRLRRAAGAEVEVIAAAQSRNEALAKVDELRLDAAVIDAELPDAGALGETLRTAGLAIVVVGPGADVEPGESLGDRLPGAITRALIARRAGG